MSDNDQSIARPGVCGVILAAGKGTRAYPYTERIPKAILDICGRPLIQFSLEIMRDKLGIRDVAIVVSDVGATIREWFGDGRDLGMRIAYVTNDQVHKGPVYSLLMAEPLVGSDRFVVMLSDEIYFDSNHEGLLKSSAPDDDITITARPNSLIRDIRRNFSIAFDGGRISRLVEKPATSENRFLGCGTYLFKKEIFDAIRESFDRASPATDNLTAFISERMEKGDRVGCFSLEGQYINVNFHHDINRARSLARLAMFP